MGLRTVAYYLIVMSVAALFLMFIYYSDFQKINYTSVPNIRNNDGIKTVAPKETIRIATHVKTPENVKAVYMTSYVAGDIARRKELVGLIEETELNSVVIDVKDFTGYIAFPIENSFLQKIGSFKNVIPNAQDFVDDLHERGIYVIGRIVAFQDPILAAKRQDLAVLVSKDSDEVWKDFKGQSWLDPGSIDVWEYLSVLGKETYKVGFDEINYDYVRFPSDGNMKDIYYPYSEGRVLTEVIKEFMAFLDKEFEGTGAVTSVDFFGMTTTNFNDLNIGQKLEDALLYFDFVAPMVYPSHYPRNFIGLANPAEKPYEVVKYSMDRAVSRASTTRYKLRPWLQDFNLGADYTPQRVREQIQAVYDAGLTSWMLWNAPNRHTTEALKTE